MQYVIKCFRESQPDKGWWVRINPERDTVGTSVDIEYATKFSAVEAWLMIRNFRVDQEPDVIASVETVNYECPNTSTQKAPS